MLSRVNVLNGRASAPQILDRLPTFFKAPSVTSGEAAQLFKTLTELGARNDAERRFPHDSLRHLRDHGVHHFLDHGSENKTTSLLLDWLRFVGRADLSLGRIYEGHINAVQLIGWYGTAHQRQVLRKHLDAGKYYGVWASEPPPGVKLKKVAGGYELEGRKIFASGAGNIDFSIVTAQGETGHRSVVIVPANDPARADSSNWQVRGMRSTMSGFYDLTGLRVSENDIVGKPGDYDSEPRFTAGAWRFLAVQLGGIEALVTEIRSAMSDAARGDPLQRLKFANAVEAMRTAYFWVAASARMFEQGDGDAPAFVRMARGVVERSATDVMNDAARIVGTRSAFDGQRIDQITRDLSLYLRQAGPDYARDQAALAWLDHDISDQDARLW